VETPSHEDGSMDMKTMPLVLLPNGGGGTKIYSRQQDANDAKLLNLGL